MTRTTNNRGGKREKTKFGDIEKKALMGIVDQFDKKK